MQKFLHQKTCELLAKERSETERDVHPKSADPEGAKNRRCSIRGCGW
ncbi:MAG: hypothetical protein QOJ17_6050 [Rhodospirillaceae bacterium]|jgi:hypothetical protein|nr:hypothetical protein [Rhodospirillaceae bacterium]